MTKLDLSKYLERFWIMQHCVFLFFLLSYFLEDWRTLKEQKIPNVRLDLISLLNFLFLMGEKRLKPTPVNRFGKNRLNTCAVSGGEDDTILSAPTLNFQIHFKHVYVRNHEYSSSQSELTSTVSSQFLIFSPQSFTVPSEFSPLSLRTSFWLVVDQDSTNLWDFHHFHSWLHNEETCRLFCFSILVLFCFILLSYLTWGYHVQLS